MNKAIPVGINLKLIIVCVFAFFVLAALIAGETGLIDNQVEVLTDAFTAFGETAVGRCFGHMASYVLAARNVGDAFFSDVEEKAIKFLQEI